jgi:hypothetical protein
MVPKLHRHETRLLSEDSGRFVGRLLMCAMRPLSPRNGQEAPRKSSRHGNADEGGIRTREARGTR